MAQATLRLRSELECERVIRLAHGRGVASATAYWGPEGDSPIFVILVDEAEQLDHFLPELLKASPEVPVSVIREEVEHVSPDAFLRGGVLHPRSFRAEAVHLGWVFAGGTLGAGARLLSKSVADHVSPLHAAFPWGTMLVNVVGSFAIAVLGALLFERFTAPRACSPRVPCTSTTTCRRWWRPSEAKRA